MRTLAPPTGRGWEAVAGDDVRGWSAELAELPTLLAEKVKAPSVTPRPTDLVIDPSNLGSPSTNPWVMPPNTTARSAMRLLTRHVIRHTGQLNTMRYGSPVMNVTANRTERFGLATVGWDDEGVQAQQWDLVRDGIFVGYQLDRVFAPRLGLPGRTAARTPTRRTMCRSSGWPTSP